MRRLPIVTENSQSTKMSSSRRVSRPKQDDGEFLLECKAAFLSVYDDIGDRVGSKKDLLTGQYCKSPLIYEHPSVCCNHPKTHVQRGYP